MMALDDGRHNRRRRFRTNVSCLVGDVPRVSTRRRRRRRKQGRSIDKRRRFHTVGPKRDGRRPSRRRWTLVGLIRRIDWVCKRRRRRDVRRLSRRTCPTRFRRRRGPFLLSFLFRACFLRLINIRMAFLGDRLRGGRLHAGPSPEEPPAVFFCLLAFFVFTLVFCQQPVSSLLISPLFVRDGLSGAFDGLFVAHHLTSSQAN